MTAALLMIPGGFILLFAGAFACRSWGYRALAGVVPMLGAIIIAAGDNHFLFMFLASSVVIGSVIGCTVRYGKSMQFLLIASSILISAISYGHYVYLVHENKGDWTRQMVEQLRDDPGKIFVTERDKSAQELIIGFLGYVKKCIPFFYLVIGYFMTFFGYVIARSLIVPKDAEAPKGIEYYRLNEYFIFPLIAGIIAVAVSINKHSVIFAFALNILLIISFLYMLQGFGVFKFMLIKKGFPGIVVPMAAFGMFFFGISAFVVFIMCVAGFGALDLWADFRRFTKKSADSGNDSNLN